VQTAERIEVDPTSDEELVREVRAGAFARFELLVRRHAGRVHRAVRSILRNERDCEDAAQQTFLQAFVGLRAFEGSASFATWVTRIAINEALMRARRARLDARPAALALVEAFPSEDAAPDDAAASREAIARVQRAVGRLPASHREVFRLRHVEGLSLAQAAGQLGITEAAAKLRLHRARAVLRRAVTEGAPITKVAARRARCSTGGGHGRG
jgi:RNA polymerase sigma-70 factor (ECF subfamily)